MKNNFSDTMVMSRRVLRHTFRSVDTLITVVAMPIIMMLMFVYVFGGAINTGSVKYINYVVPGIILMCIASGVAYTAVRLNNDVTKGIVERFRSMQRLVRLFAENQPMTPIIETVRSLMLGKAIGNNALVAVLWCVGILIASYVGTMQIYKRKAV